MNGSITINGRDIPAPCEGDELESITVEFPAADGGEDTIRCTICGQHGQGDMSYPECTETCIEEDCEDCDGSGEKPDNHGGADDGPCPHDHDVGVCFCGTCGGSGTVPQDHDWEPVPLSWVNSASIDLREGYDEVTVSISVGDPRGAFVMTIRRTDDGRMFMHVPYENMPCPHMPLTHLHGGTFQLGS